MNKLDILKKIRKDTKTNVSIEELEQIIDSFIKTFRAESAKGKDLNFGDWLVFSPSPTLDILKLVNENITKISKNTKIKHGEIPGIKADTEIDFIGHLGLFSRKHHKK